MLTIVDEGLAKATRCRQHADLWCRRLVDSEERVVKELNTTMQSATGNCHAPQALFLCHTIRRGRCDLAKWKPIRYRRKCVGNDGVKDVIQWQHHSRPSDGRKQKQSRRTGGIVLDEDNWCEVLH